MIHTDFDCQTTKNDRPNDVREMYCFLARVILRNRISLFTGVESRVTVRASDFSFRTNWNIESFQLR